jgi:DoxX-like family
MNAPLTKFSIPLLHWAVGLVVMLQSFRFVLSDSAARFLATAGLTAWIRPVLGGVEILAAVLFLLPFTALIGGYLLLAVFACAVVLHLLHGQYDVGTLVVYAVAVLVCVGHTKSGPGEFEHGRP